MNSYKKSEQKGYYKGWVEFYARYRPFFREIKDDQNASELIIKSSDISFENVSFNYDENNDAVLNNINLNIYNEYNYLNYCYICIILEINYYIIQIYLSN